MVNLNDLELREFIRQHFLKFLEREPDFAGLEHFFNNIKNGEIKPEELHSIFSNSEEHNACKIKKLVSEKVTKDLELILNEFDEYEELIKKEERIPEPSLIFVSCYNFSDDNHGGVYVIKDGFLKPILEGHHCVGLFYEKKHKVLICLIDGKPQIFAFKVKSATEFVKIPVQFSNYKFAEAAHGLCIFQDKIYVMASTGKNTEDGEMGKIVVSEIDFDQEHILIKNSKAHNPFNCSHHHHINDICEHKGTLYMSSFSYCNSDENLIDKGNISKLDRDEYQAEVINDRLNKPHSLSVFRDKLYMCSSGIGAIFSINFSNNKMKLEHKTLDTYVRGLLVTDTFFYIGLCHSIGRPDSKFKNSRIKILG